MSNNDYFIIDIDRTSDEFKIWQGLVGAHYTPYVDTEGNLSWTNNGDLPNPPTRNIRGLPGEQGEPGGRGADGVSPIVTITSVTGGHQVKITDATHPSGQTFVVTDGVDGTDGTDGTDGISPIVTITPTSDGHQVKITDATHPTGQTFNVTDGEDGVSPTVAIASTTDGHTVTITDATHPTGQTFNVTDGTDGVNGVSPAVTIAPTTDGHTVTITDATHPSGQTFNVTDGEDGVSPAVTITSVTGGHQVKITDATHPTGQTFDVMDGHDGSGVPVGGTTGQVLAKSSDTDYAVTWVNQSGGSGGGMLVTLTQSNNIKAVDKTFDEIYDALIVQKIPVMLVENIYANKFPYMPVEAMNNNNGKYIKFVRLTFTSSQFDQAYYTINKNSQGDTTVSSNIVHQYLPIIYENAWSITVAENDGVWSITEVNTPGSYYCIQHPQGSIKINTIYHLAQLDDDYMATEAFPFVKATVSEHYDSYDYGTYVPDATIYFEKIKNIGGVETRCQFAVFINCLWDDSVGGEYDTVTYTETAL